MAEKLLTIDQVANRLGVVSTTVRRHLLSLRANGLEQAPLGKRGVRFREASLDRIIRRAAERSENPFTVNVKRRSWKN